MKSRVFLFLGLLVSASVAFPMAAATAPTYFPKIDYEEDFNQYAANVQPAQEWYTFTKTGTGDFRTTTSQPKLGNTSYLADPSLNQAGEFHFESDYSASPVCTESAGTTTFDPGRTSALQLAFAFRLAALPASGDFVVFWFGDGSPAFSGTTGLPAAADHGFGLRIASTGAAVALIQYDSSSAGITDQADADTIPGITISTNTWYNVTMSNFHCYGTDPAYTQSPGLTHSWTIYFVDQDISFAQSTGEDNDNDMEQQPDALSVSLPPDAAVDLSLRFDNYFVEDAPGPPLEPTAGVDVPGANLQGFDVDDAGDTVIIRSNSGNIYTYSGPTLANFDSDLDDECNRADGVMSIGALVGYIVCDGTGDPTHFRLRTPGLDVPSSDQFSGCTDGSFTCTDEIELNGFSEAGGDCLKQLGKVESFPINYQSSRPFGGFDRRRVAWAWSDIGTGGSCSESGGKIGVDMYTNAENDADVRRTSEQTFAGSPAEEICTGVDGDQFYIAAAGTDVNTKVYPFTFQNDDFPTFGTLDGNFGSPTTFSLAYSGADSIDCGGNYVVVRNEGSLNVLHRDTGSNVGNLVTSTVESDSLERAATISPDAADGEGIVAYVNGGLIYVVRLTGNPNFSGAPLIHCTINMPAGTFKEMELTTGGPSLFIATTSRVEMFQLGGTCGEITPTGVGGEDPADPVDTDGLFGGSGAVVGAAIGVGEFGGNLFMGAILMGLVAYGVGTGYGNLDSTATGSRALRLNPWAAAVGAAIGFLLAWAFGFFSTAVVFSMVVLIGLVVGIRLFMGRSA